MEISAAPWALVAREGNNETIFPLTIRELLIAMIDTLKLCKFCSRSDKNENTIVIT